MLFRKFQKEYCNFESCNQEYFNYNSSHDPSSAAANRRLVELEEAVASYQHQLQEQNQLISSLRSRLEEEEQLRSRLETSSKDSSEELRSRQSAEEETARLQDQVGQLESELKAADQNLHKAHLCIQVRF